MKSSNWFWKDEQGTAVIEFMLWLPAAAVLIALFIGLGWTLMLRQQSLVAARYAAFYQRMGASSPSPSQVSLCVSPRGEQWQLTEASSSADSSTAGSAPGIDGGISAEFEATVSQLSTGGAISYQVEVSPTLGPLPSLLHPGNASAAYVLPTGTWTSDDCGVYQTLLTSGISVLISGF